MRARVGEREQLRAISLTENVIRTTVGEIDAARWHTNVICMRCDTNHGSSLYTKDLLTSQQAACRASLSTSDRGGEIPCIADRSRINVLHLFHLCFGVLCNLSVQLAIDLLLSLLQFLDGCHLSISAMYWCERSNRVAATHDKI